ncbi:uncharacterized protein LOC128887666 [Hylaeus anthracinus]|uniref:uncharacterized protein LOC128887666 n=1 Tax=Hylaeus anthracinus TaxID=313031 RepID=UPI0023BA36E8|nr:uncharacterized protein LOC128887666 [Hylaeus anthracinus]
MLQRTTSSRRSPATSAVPGRRGRRASVATERPVDMVQTSPRSTMERQRSPRGSYAPDPRTRVPNPDIALEQETDSSDEITDNQIGIRMSRSPRHSIVSESYYRCPRNGGRSLAPDMNYGSPHSLVPETAMSPRHSLVPDKAHDRSPRNSLVPLTASRTSLLSDNGNPMSGRPSLAPNSSRSPRGSISTMEMVYRSPQRSPRGSIASDCINQSPRNSIAPYEVHATNSNRSSRGSLGNMEIIRCGGNEDVTSPRRIVDPDYMNRNPRGSLGGLPEMNPTMKVTMAQSSRRASVDPVSENRISSSNRMIEVNCGSVNSGSSNVHLNLGYGVNAIEDTRRDSSSVSQFSGDESRRLFNSSVMIPKNNTEKDNLGVITYGSVAFQLKDANLEACSTCDFVFRALKVVSKTRIVTGCLVSYFIFSLVMLIFGWKYVKECTVEDRIPIYLVIAGILSMILMIFVGYLQLRSRKPEIMSTAPQSPEVIFTIVIIVGLSLFLIGWFVAGNYWILGIMWPTFNDNMYMKDMYCAKPLYIFSLVHLGVVYTIIASTLLLMLVLACFRILACPLPHRYK